LALDGHAVSKAETRLRAQPCFPATDPAPQPQGEELPIMEKNEDLKAHLIETNDEFRKLASQHSEYAKKLDALEALPHLSYEEQIEETRLKKLKLRLKDQMEAIVSQFRSRQVA
jgi:uncharacterized protein